MNRMHRTGVVALLCLAALTGCSATSPIQDVAAQGTAPSPAAPPAVTVEPSAPVVAQAHPIRKVLDAQPDPRKSLLIRGFTVSYTLETVYVDYQLMGSALEQYQQENEARPGAMATVYEATPAEVPWLHDDALDSALATLGPIVPGQKIYRIYAVSSVPPAHGEQPPVVPAAPAPAHA